MDKKQSQQELINHLKEQINFLTNSFIAFDKGDLSEAKRIATIIRTLLHDTDKSTSLLKQLNKKNILFYDTSIDPDLKNLLPLLGLIMLDVKSGYIAPLDNGAPSRYKKGKVDFNKWWNKIVFIDKNKNTFSRKDLVLMLANKDGGSHIDKLPESYYKLTRENSLGWKLKNNKNEESEIIGCELVSLRQIGHELFKSLSDEFLKIINK